MRSLRICASISSAGNRSQISLHETPMDTVTVYLQSWSAFTQLLVYTLVPEYRNTSIRIFNVCEMRIENSATRVTARHREGCRVMSNSYPKWWNFQFAPNNHYGFFFLHTLPSTIAFRLEYVLIYQFYTEMTTVFNRFGSYLRCWRWNVLRKITSNVTIDVLTSCTSRLTRPPPPPPHATRVRRHFLALVGFVGYARTFNLHLTTIIDSWII